jgi:hypothetical protein
MVGTHVVLRKRVCEFLSYYGYGSDTKLPVYIFWKLINIIKKSIEIAAEP